MENTYLVCEGVYNLSSLNTIIADANHSAYEMLRNAEHRFQSFLEDDVVCCIRIEIDFANPSLSVIDNKIIFQIESIEIARVGVQL